MKYEKAALTFDEQLLRIRTRGMRVEDEAAALHWLKTVGYYRLSGYFHPFKQADDNYVPGTAFEMPCALYDFDRRLRLLVLDAIEKIEVALRTAVTYRIGIDGGPFGHCDASRFSATYRHTDLLALIQKSANDSDERFVVHFRTKYAQERHLPIWMATELLSFGAVSRMYADQHQRMRRLIASHFNTPELLLKSWMHALTYLRNLCAHHSRVWNRTLGIKPKLPQNPERWWPYRIEANDRIYPLLIIIVHFLRTIAPQSSWNRKLVDLLDEFPMVPVSEMGFPADWRNRPPWR
jgi:abortive infection bacteriophage resistance protein